MSYQASMATAKLYRSVIEEVINGVREAFLDEGVDEQILQELKTTWETKVLATKAVDTLSDHPPPAGAASSTTSHGRSNQASSHSNFGAGSANNAAIKHSNAISVVQAAPPAATSVVVATPPTAAGSGGGFLPLVGQRVYPQATGSAMVANFSAFQSGVLATGLIPGLQGPVRYAAQLPTIPAQMMHGNQNTQRRNLDGGRNGGLPQVDGPGGVSDDEDDFEDQDDAQEPVDEPTETTGVEEGEPLNSEDDVSNEDAEEMFEADNVIVCQYEKVTRTRNKWKFVLKDGVMNLDGKDFVFNRANGEAEF